MGSESAMLVCCFCCLVLPSVVLQTCGFFSPFWIKHNSTTDCFLGVVYNKDCPDDTKGLGSAVLGLQATAFTIIALTTVISICFICCNNDDEDDDDDVGCCAKFGVCLICLYPVAGIIGFAGCMVVVADYGDHDKGWSFYLCLVASCYVILEMIFCCCVLCKAAKEDNSDTEGGQGNAGYVGDEVQHYGTRYDGQSVTSPSGGGMIVGQIMEHQQVALTGTGSLIVRKLQIARVFRIS
ncbi:uncharacterized protein LOC125673050 isoform X1 [Ostrea edulis]|uniref:uncharacterized protein LOC125673050 isoform X1 n=1 Tax=Ostrea edulis TaxID=37623 RepID=UPI00209613C9|nr:uncharacterized protein LOC125673050 isoform X1 [Ostrea edulis]